MGGTGFPTLFYCEFYNQGLPPTPPPPCLVEGTRTGKAVCTIYAPGREGSEVILWTLEDGGHTWPGGKSTLPESQVGKINTDISASELMWQFFEKHPSQEKSSGLQE